MSLLDTYTFNCTPESFAPSTASVNLGDLTEYRVPTVELIVDDWMAELESELSDEIAEVKDYDVAPPDDKYKSWALAITRDILTMVAESAIHFRIRMPVVPSISYDYKGRIELTLHFRIVAGRISILFAQSCQGIKVIHVDQNSNVNSRVVGSW